MHARFIPPMLLLRRDSLPEGPEWLYEILCGPPHKILWPPELCGAGDRVAKNENAALFPTPHNFLSKALQELHQCGVLLPVL